MARNHPGILFAYFADDALCHCAGEKLRKIAAWFAGATSAGEREAAEAAFGWVRAALAATTVCVPTDTLICRAVESWQECLQYEWRLSTCSAPAKQIK
jgi:hypothetical protein